MYNFIKQIRDDYHIKKEEIETIEKKYKILFPKILKDYYLKYNGDIIKLCIFTVDGYEYSIVKMVQLKYGTATFEHIVDNDREDGIIEENLLPIARNEGGDYYYWDTISENVFLYYCDDIENPIFICENIEELFKILESSCSK